MGISVDKLPELYRLMYLGRQFENITIRMFTNNELPGFLHSQLGQEAIPIGVSSCLEKDDFVQTTHRGHVDMIAKGLDVKLMMAELFAKKTGYNHGKGGSMHMGCMERGLMAPTGIVGSGPVIAIGIALSFKMKNENRVIVNFLGEGAANEGSVHEAFNMAALWDLPVVFIIQNNQYAESTPRKDHQKVENLADRAAGYGIPGYTCDGNDVLSVHETAKKAIDHARAGKGPSIINAVTYRIMGHYVGDPGSLYRTKEEVEDAWKNDPLARFRSYLLKEKKIQIEILDNIEQGADQLLQEAVEFAKCSPEPGTEDLLTNIYF